MSQNGGMFKEQETDSLVFFKVDGEPAVVINGLPNNLSFMKTRAGSRDRTRKMWRADDPVFGELLEGRKVKKLFGRLYYHGEVVKYDSEVNWYRVVYEDGDSEDLDWHELEEVLLPLDINIPLKMLPFQSFLHDESKITMPIVTNSQISQQICEVPIQIDYKTGRNCGETNLKE